MAKCYLTWGVGYGKKVIAQKNAQMDANIDKIKINKLPKLEVPRCKIISDRKKLARKKGDFSGIVLQNCAKSPVVSYLSFGITEDKIIIGRSKTAGIRKAEKQATYDAKKSAEKQNLKIESVQHIAATAKPKKKGEYACAIVALILE